MSLTGKIALVTGAASGIGRAVADALRAAGANVLAADLEPGVDLKLDVSSEPDWQRVMSDIPRLDVVVACAGIAHAQPLLETELTAWRRVMAVNLDGAFLTVKHSAPAMTEGGSIVLLGSASGVKPAPGAAAYCCSKAALAMLAKSAALELKSKAIRVNSVSPAGVVTPMWKKQPFWDGLVAEHGGEDGAWKALGGADPAEPALHRMALPDEVAQAVLFLASSASAHMTGADLAFDAGYTL